MCVNEFNKITNYHHVTGNAYVKVRTKIKTDSFQLFSIIYLNTRRIQHISRSSSLDESS